MNLNDRILKVSKWVATSCIISSTGLLMACGSGAMTPIQTKSCLDACPTDPSEQNSNNPPGADHPAPALDFKAVHSGNNEGHIAAIIDTDEESLVLYLPLSSFFSLGEIDGSSTKLPGVYFKSHVMNDGSSRLAVHVPLEYIAKDLDWINSGRLPNGQALPAIPDGELPTINMPIGSTKLDLHLYLGPSVVAFFITSPFDPFLKLQVPIRDTTRQKVVGYFVSIPETDTHPGGFFMSTTLPSDLARIIDDHFAVE